MSYVSKIHFKQGLTGGDEIVVESGGKITNAGTQASAVADATAITGGDAPTEAEHNALLGKVNSILAALRGVGILAP